MANIFWSQVVKLTDYNTIKGNKFQEISINRFLKKLEKSIDKGNDFKRYDYNTFSFWYPDLHNTFYLCLDETLMANFDKGFYTPFTKELKRLLDKKEKMDKKKSLLDLASKQSSLAEEIDKEALPLYLSEKRKDLGFSFDDIKDYFKNLKNDLINAKYDTRYALNHKIWPYKEFELTLVKSITLAISAVSLVVTVPSAVEFDNFIYFLFSLIPFGVVYTVPALTFLYNYGKTRINRLINFVDRRKYAKEEIKSLTETNPEIQLITDGKDKEEKYIMLDEKTSKKEDKKSDSDIPEMILSELFDLISEVEKIPSINERNRMLEKVQNLLNKYNEHIKVIENNERDGKLLIQNYEMLKFSLIPLIERVRLEIKGVIEQTVASQERQDMAKLLQQKIDNIKIKKKTNI